MNNLLNVASSQVLRVTEEARRRGVDTDALLEQVIDLGLGEVQYWERPEWGKDRHLAPGTSRLILEMTTDRQTGLPNRQIFMAHLAYEIERSQHFAAPLQVLLLDLDHFKSVNDRMGFPAGDDLLRVCAQALAQSSQGGGFVARLGGDEFAALVPAEARSAFSFAEKLRTAISSLDAPWGRVTASVGIAAFRGSNDTAEDLLGRADTALYEAKRTGRERTVAFDDFNGGPGTTVATPLSPTAALFASWAAEDPVTGPEDAAQRQREGDELLAALDASPLSLRRVDLSGWPDEDAA